MQPKLYLVIPCYNEEEMLPYTYEVLAKKLADLVAAGKVDAQSKVMLVDDGSKDKTWPMICDLHQKDARFVGLKLSRNRGHQNALLAGLMTAKDRADVVVSMDADLQDDPNAIDGFLEAYAKGYEVVLGVRSSRKSDSFFKRFTAEGYYKVLERLGVQITYNHADYRLMTARALEMLGEFGEVNLFLRGMVPQVGLKTTTVEYVRTPRIAGESKYSLKKMLALAWQGVTSFSTKPLKWVFWLSVLCFLAATALFVTQIVFWCLGQAGPQGLLVHMSVWLLGAVQLLGLGLVGEYVGKIFAEVKRRPRYFIETDLEQE